MNHYVVNSIGRRITKRVRLFICAKCNIEFLHTQVTCRPKYCHDCRVVVAKTKNTQDARRYRAKSKPRIKTQPKIKYAGWSP